MKTDAERIAECEDAGLPHGSRLCDICAGKIFGIEDTNGYRANWGLPALDGTEVQPRVIQRVKFEPRPKESLPASVKSASTNAQPKRVPLDKQVKTTKGCSSCGGTKKHTSAARIVNAGPRLNGYGPGSQLLKAWSDMPHCDACYALAAKMDSWGVDGCLTKTDEIVADILPRAKTWVAENHGWAHRVLSAVTAEDALLRVGIKRSVKQAIAETERLYNPQPEQNELAAIVPFYNFSGSSSRVSNYFACVEHLRNRGFAVFTVEAELEGKQFYIPQDERTMRFTVRDPLFIKESLFNIALRNLPPRYSAVAWPDADVLFERPDIVNATLAALKEYPVVQMFRTIRWLNAEGAPERRWVRDYAGAAFHHSEKKDGHRAIGKWPGLAWAARRSVLDEIGGLYDGYPGGSGDVFALTAFYGNTTARYFRKYAAKTIEHYAPWREKTYRIVKGRVGYVDTVIYHRYHGSLRDRQYNNRHSDLRSCGFDPVKHLERNQDGIYQFSTSCPQAARQWMDDYMLRLRKEP